MSTESPRTLLEELLDEIDAKELTRRAIAICTSRWESPYHDAEDSVQRCLLRASQYVPPQEKDHKPWRLFTTMLKNQTIDQRRKQRRLREIFAEDLDSTTSYDKSIHQDSCIDLSLDLQSAIASLPPVLRETLETLDYHGGNYEATGADLGISGTAVRYRCKRVQSHLAQQPELLEGLPATEPKLVRINAV